MCFLPLESEGGKMKRNYWMLSLAVLGLILFVSGVNDTVHADRLEMVDGSVLWGRFLGSTEDTVDFQFIWGTATFALDVLSITFVEPAPLWAPAFGEDISVYRAEPVTLPAGTRILVWTIDGISSQVYGPGYIFTAVLANDLVAEGVVLVTQGTVLAGRVAHTRRMGRAGRPWLTVKLTSLTVGGIVYPVSTTLVRAEGEDTRWRTPRSAGRRYGSRGLRRGVTVGTAGPVRPRGRQIEIPARTLLEFALSEPFVYSR